MKINISSDETIDGDICSITINDEVLKNLVEIVETLRNSPAYLFEEGCVPAIVLNKGIAIESTVDKVLHHQRLNISADGRLTVEWETRKEWETLSGYYDWDKEYFELNDLLECEDIVYIPIIKM